MYIDTSTAENLLTRLRIGGWEQINGYEIQRTTSTTFTWLSQSDRSEGRAPMGRGGSTAEEAVSIAADFVTRTCDLQGRTHKTCHCGQRIHEKHVTARTYWDAPWVHCDPTVGHGADIRPAA